MRHALADGGNELLISEATWWEICVKLSLKKLELLGGVESLREEWIGRGVAESLPVEWRHARRLADLPFVHRDPFDRMLVVQALTERLTLVGGDSCFAGYPGLDVFLVSWVGRSSPAAAGFEAAREDARPPQERRCFRRGAPRA